MIASLAMVVVGIGLASAMLWASCNRLEEATHRLAAHYGVPDIVRGSIITAVSSSMPELLTAVLAVGLHGDFELGLAAIIGSAIYNVLVIPAASVLSVGRPLASNRELVFREAQFYLVSVCVFLLVLSLAVIYNGGAQDFANGTQIVRGEMTRLLALVPLGLYGLYLFIQYQEVKDSRRATQRATGMHPFKEWTVLLFTILVTAVGVEILLRAALLLGDLLGTPTFLWGMTVVAAATSIPDTLISVRASELGRVEAAVSNVLGSNVFDLLVAVPLAVLIAGAVTVNFTQAVPMMAFLMLATIVMLVFMRRDMELSRNEALAMLALYLAFGVWMALEAFGVVDALGLARV